MTGESEGLLLELPPERRIQARAAITGSVDGLVVRLRCIRALPKGAWQATLAARFIEDCAARWRPPDQVAQLAVRLCMCQSHASAHRPTRAVPLVSQSRSHCGSTFILDTAAAHRSPYELAEIASELHRLTNPKFSGESDLAERFLRSVTNRRLPSEIAELLGTLPADGLLREVLIVLVSTAPPHSNACVMLYLRGSGEQKLIEAIVSALVKSWAGAKLAALVVDLNRWGSYETVGTIIDMATTWAAPGEPSPATCAVSPRVGQITDLVTALCEGKHISLAKQVTSSAVTNFTLPGQRYRLYALIFVFKQHDMHDEVEQVIYQISASQQKDSEVDMVVMWISENRDKQEDIANLLDAILRSPTSRTGRAAVKLAKKLASDRLLVFERVSKWAHEDIDAFRKALCVTSPGWANEFLESVADNAGAGDDASDVSNIVLLLLRDWAGRSRKERRSAMRRADRLVGRVVRYGKPELLVTLICTLEDYRNGEYRVTDGNRHQGWWTLRDAAEKEIAVRYAAEDMVRLIEFGAERCLTAILRLTPGWLTNPHRTDADVVAVVAALNGAEGNPRDLARTLEWSASQLHRPDGSTPIAALEAAGLQAEANAWVRGRHWGWPHRPDPDPPR